VFGGDAQRGFGGGAGVAVQSHRPADADNGVNTMSGQDSVNPLSYGKYVLRLSSCVG
jgi:hypothetical protein